MAINKNFVVRNGLEVANNLIIANDVTNKVGIGTTNPLVELDVRGDVNAYRFYGDQVRYPDWQFFGNLDGTARRSLDSDTSDFASTSDFATEAGNADTADFASEAGNAATADFATEAGNASTADFATEAGNASTADFATEAENADNIAISDTSVDDIHYIHFNDTISGYDDVNISSTKLVFNPFSGNLGVNVSSPLTNLQVDFYGVQSKIITVPASNINPSIIDSFLLLQSDFKTAEYTLLIENSTNIQTQKVLVMQNGTDSYYQEYSIMYDPIPIVSISSTISSGWHLLQSITLPEITGDVTYKFVRQTML